MKKSSLHNITKTGYEVPKDYFESFNDTLFEKLEGTSKIEGIEDTGFKVPDDYFDFVEASVTNKLKKEEHVPVIKIKSRRSLYYLSGIAASILLLVAIFINRPTTEELSIEMVETYFEDRDLDTYELAELLSGANLLEEDFTITETQYSEDHLETYLLEHTDIESILE